MHRRLAAFLLIRGFLFASPEDATTAANDVARAFQEGDAAKVESLARRADPDPWLVASRLCRAGHHDAAAAFADAAAVGGETAALRQYVAARRHGSDDAVAKAADLLNAGRALRAQGRLAEAETSLERAARLASDLGWLRHAEAGFRLAGDCARRSARYERAETLWEEWLAVAGRTGDAAREASPRRDLASLCALLGDYDRALDLYARALASFRAAGRDRDAAAVLCNIGLVHHSRGSFRDELKSCTEALELLPAGAPPRASVELQLAGALRELGDYEGALRMIRNAQRVFEAAGDTVGISRCLGTLSAVRDGMGDYPGMREAARETVRRLQALTDPSPTERWFLAGALTNAGLAEDHLGRPHEGMGFHERALRLAESLGDPRLIASIHLNLSFSLHAAGDAARAKEHAAPALEHAKKLASARFETQARLGLARAFLAAGRPEDAVRESLAGLDAVAVQTAGLAEGQGAQARSHHARLFAVALQAATLYGDPSALLDVQERGRAVTLLESLKGQSALRAAVIPRALAREESRARAGERRATFLYREAVRAGEVALIRKRREQLAVARSGLREAVARIQRDARSGHALLYPHYTAKRELQRLLDGRQAFVLFALLENEAVALVLRREKARIVRLGQVVPALRDHLALPRRDAFSGPSLVRLRSSLVDPLQLDGTVSQILLSPDGVLFDVPFAALLPDTVIAYVPSGTVYALLRAEGARVRQGVLALGGVTPGDGNGLPALPGSRAEAESIGGTTLLGTAATRSGFEAKLLGRSGWRAVHLACHAVFDSADPLQSGLELADGRLTVLDTFGMRIPADLVVLSACETGRGAYFRGEGRVGLTRAFMCAGAPRVIVSLWKVDDEATRTLMVKFYELWNPKDGSKGLPTATALKKAQQFVKGHEKWEHPYYWAAWQLWGLGD